MGKYLYLLFMGVLGLSISVFSFYKGTIYLSEINHFIQGDKSFFEVFIEPKRNFKKQVSAERSYLNIENYKDVQQACYKLHGAGNFVKNYLYGFVNVNYPLSEQIVSIRLLKEYDNFIQSSFGIHESEKRGKYLAYNYDISNCNSSLQAMSDIVYKIASVSSKNEIKRLSKFIKNDALSFYEAGNIVISYPFVFYFENGEVHDFKYFNLNESHKATDYLVKTT